MTNKGNVKKNFLGGKPKMAGWTFLTNHALILSFLAMHVSITARQLAMEIGITERAVRKIIADLQAEGYILKEKEGRRVRYSINPRLPLRHETHRDKEVGNILKVLGWSGKGRHIKIPRDQ
jgi:DNA-binding transcriptional ArsR family regulator